MATKPNPRLRMNAGILSKLESALRHARRERASREINELFAAHPVLKSYFDSWVVADLVRVVAEVKRDYLPAYIAAFADDYLRQMRGGRLKRCRDNHDACSPTLNGGCSAALLAEYPAFAELVKDAQAAPQTPAEGAQTPAREPYRNQFKVSEKMNVADARRRIERAGFRVHNSNSTRNRWNVFDAEDKPVRSLLTRAALIRFARAQRAD